MPKKEVAGREEMASIPRRECSEERKRRRRLGEKESRDGERANKEILGVNKKKECRAGREGNAGEGGWNKKEMASGPRRECSEERERRRRL